MSHTIRRLGPEEVDVFAAVRRRSLQEHPSAFGSSVPEHDALPREGLIERLSGNAGSALFGAFVGDALVGVCGVHHPVRLKRKHRVNIWGMYVAAEARGRRIGRDLLRACVAHARTIPEVDTVMLSVNVKNPHARELYVAEGFVSWGTDPDSFRVHGEPQDEEFFNLPL